MTDQIEEVRAAEVRQGDVLVDHDGECSRVLDAKVRDGVCLWLTPEWGDMARMPNEFVRRVR